MNGPQLAFERSRFLALRDRLLADDPEIDEQALADTVEGATNYTDALAAVVRAALTDEATAGALREMAQAMAERIKRFEDRAETRRALVRDEMEKAGLHRLNTPDFTASLRSVSPAVIVTDDKAIPPSYFEMRPHLKKQELQNALRAGIPVAGAMLNNPRMTLSVRTR